MRNRKLMGSAGVMAVAGALFFASKFYGVYNYTFVPFNAGSGTWQFNGAVTANGVELVTSGSGAGGAVYLPTMANPADYEVRTTLRLNSSGGTYVTFIRASNDALPGNQGSWYALEVQNPTFSSAPGNPCTATAVLSKRIGGVYSVLSSVPVPCKNMMQVRLVAISYDATNGALLGYIDNHGYLYAAINNPQLPSGKPGAGLINAPAGSGIAQFDIGARDTMGPNAIDMNYLSTWTYSNRVDFLVKPPWDNGAPGAATGVSGYQIYRLNSANGQWELKIQADQGGFSDTTVAAGTAYSYRIYAIDYHNNFGPYYQFNVQTPPSGSVDPRGAGIKPTSTTWGALGEQIDMQSGNLNYTFPLVKAQARGGWGATFSLNYNSQMWRRDPNSTWLNGEDVGYGFGWKLLAGSLQTFRDGFWTVHHYRFTDSTGAEYILDTNTNGVWTASKDPTYISYQESTNRLYFTDGTFWLMDVVTAGLDHDAGTRYPRIMQDRNGNQIIISYMAAREVNFANSSGRISTIEDVRAPYPNYKTYTFTYNTDPIPHLTTVTNHINNEEGYALGYNAGQTYTSPFGTGEVYGPFQTLTSISLTGIANMVTTFSYSPSSGEMTQMSTPYGGQLIWSYREFTFSGSRKYREVQHRDFRKDSGAPLVRYTLVRNEGDSALSVHSSATMTDPSGIGQKVWTFQTNTAQPNVGLVTAYDSRQSAGGTLLSRQEYTWTTSGKPYVSAVLNRIDPGQSYEKQSKTEQTLDAWGNTTLMKEYNFGSGTAPETTASRVTTITYNTSQEFADRFMRSFAATVSSPGGSFQYTYGGSSGQTLAGIKQHDPAFNGPAQQVRANPAIVVTSSGTYQMSYDYAGNVTWTSGPQGTQTTQNGYNYTVPTQITPNGNSSFATNLAYSSFLGLSSVSGPNGASWSMSYDNGRPSSTVSPHGATTGITYSASPAWKRTGTNSRWTKEWMDGVGRVKKTESGDGSGAKSAVDTEYDSCACSPVGKVKRVSQPYPANGAASAWTTYNYDGLGRVVNIQHPGGTGTTYYSYQGDKITVTDPAGKWKRYTTDAFGNLMQVAEPRPAGGEYTTSYTYNVRGQLLTVSMPRDGTTQARTFTYDGAGKMLTETHPETGTTTFTYNADNTLNYKVDAKGQKIEFVYDSMKRVFQVKKYPSTAPGVQEKLCERVEYIYDGYLGMTQNGVGRLSAVKFGSTDAACAMPGAFEEIYSYTQGGALTNKSLRLTQNVFGVGLKQATLSAVQEYNNEGQMTKQYYPGVWAGSPATMQPIPTYQFVYDSMARLYQIKETNPQQNYYHVAEVNYGVASEIGNIKYNNWSQTQTRQYNVRLQMTRITAPGMDIEYLYSATQNNGQITGMKQWNGGSLVQQVAYTYDSLARLSNAQTTGGSVSWNLTFGMDGFGNLNSQTGAGPNWNQYTNPVNNRISSFTYDSNGNTTATAGPSSTVYAYDVENRLLQTTMPNGGGVERYGYGVGNQRVWRQKANGQYEYYFYKLSGERFGKYSVANLGQGNSDIGFFLIEQESVVPKGMQMNRDRLGNVMYSSNTVYYPYGEEYSVTANDKDKFATYHRDSTTGLDYANNRYYSTQSARFLTADPYRASGGPADPGSWNRYAYVGSDPVNFGDPAGKQRIRTVCISETVNVEGFPHLKVDCENVPEVDKDLPDVRPPAEVLAADPSCSITAVSSGTPRNQNFVGLTSYSPSSNSLGAYSTVGREGISKDLEGWFFAMQFQGTLSGDLDPANWTPIQTISSTGTLRIEVPLEARTVDTGSKPHDDSPDERAVSRARGRVDWLDAPGQGRNLDRGWTVTGANTSYSGTSTLRHKSGASCSVSWKIELKDLTAGWQRTQ